MWRMNSIEIAQRVKTAQNTEKQRTIKEESRGNTGDTLQGPNQTKIVKSQMYWADIKFDLRVVFNVPTKKTMGNFAENCKSKYFCSIPWLCYWRKRSQGRLENQGKDRECVIKFFPLQPAPCHSPSPNLPVPPYLCQWGIEVNLVHVWIGCPFSLAVPLHVMELWRLCCCRAKTGSIDPLWGMVPQIGL